MSDFRPHSYNPGMDDGRQLYHVYDSASQTPYRFPYGIRAGKCHRNRNRGYYRDRITTASVSNHLDWTNRDPTPFISLYSNWDKARMEAERRAERGRYGVARDDVEIAVVSVRMLEELGCFYFSGRQLLGPRMLDQAWGRPFGRGQHRVGRFEWFVMDRIPEDAVSECISFN